MVTVCVHLGHSSVYDTHGSIQYYRMACLLGNNSVPVLATLFLLSYAKLFCVINKAMKFTMLMNENGTTTAVWSYDGSIDYFSLCHSILLTVSVF